MLLKNKTNKLERKLDSTKGGKKQLMYMKTLNLELNNWTFHEMFFSIITLKYAEIQLQANSQQHFINIHEGKFHPQKNVRMSNKI